jgi:hypothetical protein
MTSAADRGLVLFRPPIRLCLDREKVSSATEDEVVRIFLRVALDLLEDGVEVKRLAGRPVIEADKNVGTHCVFSL